MMTGIQAEGACPVTNAFKKGDKRVVPVENPETIATAIRIGAPVSDIKALNAIYDSNGYSETVTDEEILDAQKLLARTEGIGVEPASAASIAGLKKLVENGQIDKGERVVCVVTGHVLKDPNVAIEACEEPTQVSSDPEAIRDVIRQM
jgi:threonine synthase